MRGKLLAWLGKKVPLTPDAREEMKQRVKEAYAKGLAFSYLSFDVIPEAEIRKMYADFLRSQGYSSNKPWVLTVEEIKKEMRDSPQAEEAGKFLLDRIDRLSDEELKEEYFRIFY